MGSLAHKFLDDNNRVIEKRKFSRERLEIRQKESQQQQEQPGKSPFHLANSVAG